MSFLRKALRVGLKSIATALGLAVLGAIILYVITRGDYDPPALVTEDTSLPSATIGGVKLHAESYGREGDPVIIVLHGGPGGDYRSLLPLKALADDGYDMFFYDQRGAGLSERLPEEALTLEHHLAELDAVIAYLDPERPVTLIGHSWGAMLASAYLGHAPKSVARAVLMEPGFLSAAQSDINSAHMSRAMQTPRFGITAMMTGFRAAHVRGPDEHASTDYLMGEMAHAFAAHDDIHYACDGETWDSPSWRTGGATMREVQAQASRADLDSLGGGAAFPGPVLFVSGACSHWLGAALQSENAKRFANARHVDIPNAGHDMVDDQPEATLAALRAFLKETESN